MALPPLNIDGELPPGVHVCSIDQALERFGSASEKRRLVGMRLRRVAQLVFATGHASRIIIFGSFLSAKLEPNDIDIFLVMDDNFDLSNIRGEQRLVFEHAAAQAHFGASVFWVRRVACFPSESEMVSGWGLKRNGKIRGVVELEMEAS